MYHWQSDEEEGVVVGRVPPNRWRVQLASGEEVTARISGFLWFRRTDPVIGARVRIAHGDGTVLPATIIRCYGA
ncbi:MAG: hypothetical protein ACREMZ_11480 [Gemmatimonadales bacterium]